MVVYGFMVYYDFDLRLMIKIKVNLLLILVLFIKIFVGILDFIYYCIFND